MIDLLLFPRGRRRRRGGGGGGDGVGMMQLLPAFLLVAAAGAAGAEARKLKMSEFSFTSPLYNYSFVENGRAMANCDDLIRPGVPLLPECKSVEFRVIGGDTDSNGVSSKDRFDASAHRLGNFVFLRIEQRKGQQPLNRELKSHYTLLVRAHCTKRDSSKLETATSVSIRVIDVNDQSPLPEEDLVEATLDAQSAPFTLVVCVAASDADDGMNGEVVFSLAEKNHDFIIEPLTGCIRTVKSPLRTNSTTLKVKIEDRASRLFYYDEKTRVEATTMEVKITIVDRKRDRLNVLVEKRGVDRGEERREQPQIAALIRVEEERNPEEKEPKYEVVVLDEHGSGGIFEVRRESAASWSLLTRPGMEIPEKPTVTIRAGSDSSHDRNTTAEIVIETTELHNVTFEKPRYDLSVREDLPIGRPIGAVAATVARREDSRLLKYRLEKIDDGDLPFSIDEESGRIRVAGVMNYEGKNEYTFNVMVKLTGYGHQSMVSVIVRVEDANDLAPSFPAKLSRLQSIPIPKDAKKGFLLLNVSAPDRDSGVNGAVTYRLVSLPPSKGEPPFTIDAAGNITLGRLPSNESAWMVGVVASDGGIPPRFSQLVLAFHKNGTKPLKMPESRLVVNVNEHAPVLMEEEEPFEVDEDVPVGKVIGRIPARDEDSSLAASLRFATLDHHIDIDDNGTITVARPLSELLPPGKEEILHPFTVTAYDRGIPPKSAERKYAVRIRDVNDHAPVFDKPWYRIRVAENMAVGTVLMSVSATDEDGGENGRVRYEVAGWNTIADASSTTDGDGSLITVDEKSGEITLRAPLDREEAESHRLTIMAYDGGSPSRISFANLSILMDDVNDNPPRCTHQVVKFRVAEDWPEGALVGCLAAHDEDSGANGRLGYAIEAGERKELPFRVEAHTGCVFVKGKQPLDYEKRSKYNISIEVSDNGETQHRTICQMEVQLIDVNENRYPPLFEDTVLEASVYENEAVGTLVINLVVSDADGEGGNATLEIVGGDGRAAFTVVGGDVRTAQILDRERKADYWITVRATDNAPVPLSSHVFVYIRVLDRSDHYPVFKQPFYTAEVMENAPSDTVVVKVEAEDADWPPSGKPAQLKYSISAGDPQSLFSMDPLTGYITTRGSRKLDRETQKLHDLEVKVTTLDEKENSWTIVRVFVAISDDNDNSPYFVHSNKHEYEVPAGKRGRLCRIVATDMDEGVNAELHFSLKTLEPGFTIDDEGFIETSKELKDGQIYSLDVIVKDGGTPSREAERRIVLSAVKMDAVGKENNAAPKFEQSDTYKFDVSDADSVGTPIGILSATDEDGHRLWWSLVENESSNFSSFFDMNSRTGYLVLAKPIDRLPPSVNKIELTVRVTDGKAETDAKVLIQLARQPASRPLFEKAHYEITLSEKTPIGTSILAPSVTGYGSRAIEYGIHSAESARALTTIGVDPSTGNVMLIGSLDFEAEAKFRAVLYSKQGSLMGYSMLSVRVEDENDNPPIFTHSEYEVTVQSNTSAGTVVATVTAFDSDEGENGLVVYDIISGNELGFFSMDRESGEVRTTGVMEHSEHYESILTLRASDRGGENGALTSLATLRVRTSDGGEDGAHGGAPLFQRSLYHVSVRENTPVGSLLLAVRASSRDGHIRYEMGKKCSWLQVHPVSGAVRLKRWLTKIRSKSINCTIVARGPNEREAVTKIVLRIIETNENSPVFRQQIYRGVVRENGTTGVAVQSMEGGGPLVVSATDRDSGTNALIGYRLLKDDPYFTVDLLSGTIRARRPLDFERVREWRFHVTAQDMGHPPRFASLPALVVVRVEDVNDSPPSFPLGPSIDVDLVFPTAAGVRLATIHAIDEDTVGEVRYYLRGGGEEKTRGLFRLHPKTGVLTVVTGDRKNFTERSYTLGVLATDGVHTASQEVRIRVKNASQSDLRFSQSVYVTSLEEGTKMPGQIPLITVQASFLPDPSKEVIYSLLNTRDDFTILPSTGLISFIGESIDREEEDHVLLLVQARTRSNVSAQCIVRVSIGDVNESPPRFLALPYLGAVTKSAKAGVKILTVHAVDTDHGVNGSVTYSSPDLPPLLSLHPTSGVITLKKAIDSNDDVLEFTVTATDGGTPALSSSTVVKVEVVDSMRPRFTKKEWRGRVKREGARRGEGVVTVEGRSDAARARLVYSIEGGDEDGVFEIDMDTGVISLRESSIGLEKEEFELRVAVMDAIRPTMRDTTRVMIEMDSSSSSLAFSNSTYRISLNEETPPGTSLLSLSLSSPLEGVIYSLSGPNASVFRLDSSTGLLSLASQLDFEQTRLYVLKGSAEESGEGKEKRAPAQATIIVEVEDANDETPFFVNPFSSASIPDSAKPGDFVTLMRVVDKDTVSSLPEGARLLYSVIDGDDTLFTVDKHTGVVRVGREIEEEDLVERRKAMNVSVSDGLQTAFGRLTIDISVSGSRSRVPRFEQSQYVVSMKESSMRSISSSLTRVRAIGGVAPLHYSLGGGPSASWPVGVDHASGKIHMKKKIERSQKDYVIPLIATDSLGRRAFSTLTLRIVEENDHSPQFALKEYSCSISAGAKSGESLVSISASDEDEGDSIEYALMGDAKGLRIDERIGIISVGSESGLSKLAGSSLSLIVRATDGGNPPHSTTVPLTLNVLAPDVAIPRFANSLYRFTVAEDAAVGFLVGRVQQIATDVGEVRYEMQSSSSSSLSLPFTVEKTGKILVQALLDREKTSSYRFVLVAHAAGGAHSLTTVSIEVEDVNDNAPLFRGAYDAISVREDAPMGTSVGVFSATDEDVSSSGKIAFSLLESPSSSSFSMDSSSGWLSVAAPLDRETKADYSLTARVVDQGGKSTDLPFTLKIDDVNDSPPLFDERNYTIRIDPSILADSQTIGRVTVKDADLPPHNVTQLYIISGNEEGLFSVDSTGRITVSEGGAAGLLAAGARSIDIQVLAHDGVHSRTAIVTIISSPSSSGRVECPEGERVVRVKEDVPVGHPLPLPLSPLKAALYSLSSPSSDPLPLSMDESDGSVKTSAKLDREKISLYSFIRRSISSPSGVECEERVRVEVEDVNDHAPVFEKEMYEIGVKENEVASEDERIFLIRVRATDEDRGAAGRVTYALLPHSDNAPFRMDASTGVLTLVETLDREKKGEYSLSVVATDGGEPQRSAKATVKISVADQNDNAPEFERKEYTTRIMESESVGYEILSVAAIGGDEGERVKYELVEGHAHNAYVEIGETSGILKLRTPVDYEKERSLVVRVRATDSGSPPLSTETSVTIEIMDENDNVPRFEKEKYEWSVKESEKEGAVVGKVSASDADSGHLGSVEYSIEERSEGEEKERKAKGKKEKKRIPFEIGRESGEIRLSGKIDYEKTTEYHFDIRATDGGGRYSVVAALILVEDVNDNPPLFASCNLTAIAQKSVEPGHVLLSVSVSDADSEKNGGPPFKMMIEGEGADALAIDDRMNVVTTARLARVQKESLHLKVRATDGGGKSAECPLVVHLKEESTHPPKANPLSIKLITLYGEYAGGDIGWVEGTDEDEEDSVRYALVEESVRSPDERVHQFRVDPEVGSLWAAPGIPSGTHTMNVSVTDGKFYAYAPVTIEVMEITEEAIAHTLIVRVEASIAEFYARYKKEFKKSVAPILNVQPDQIIILSVVEADSVENGEKGRRLSRAAPSKAVDVAFIAQRRSRTPGVLQSKHFYAKAAKGEGGLKKPFSVQPEGCGKRNCRAGVCVDEVIFMEGSPRKYSIRDEEEKGGTTSSLVVPPFKRSRSCKCPQGKGGIDCEEEVNGCARASCTKYEMCVPLSMGAGREVECVCPPSTTGKKCDQMEAETPTIHVEKNAFFEVDLPSSLDRSMMISIEFRTTTREGYLMYAEGEKKDYHALKIKEGTISYSWDSGRGETSVESTIEVADGSWHTVWVERKGRLVEMRVDKGAKIMGEAPAGGEVVNLGRWSRVLVMGTKVRFDVEDPSHFERSHGLSACIRKIELDGSPLVLTSTGLRLFAAKLGCRELAVSPCYGVNATAVCKNEGRCIPTGESFECECSSGFGGRDCSLDLDPCGNLSGESPCPVGITCIPLEGRAQCQCPLGHTGQRCEKRDKNFVARPDACSPNPCGSGTCIDVSSSQTHIGSTNFLCKCGDNYLQTKCGQDEISAFLSIYAKEFIVGLGAMVIIALIALIIYKFCRYRSDKKDSSLIYDDHVYSPHGVNPKLGGGGGHHQLLPSTGHSTLIQPPPPLPPRTFRNGRPTIEVRPYAADERVGSSKGDSGESLNGSFGKMRKGAGGGGVNIHRASESRGSEHYDMSRSMDGDSSAMRDLEALRRIGLPLPLDDEMMGNGGGGGGGGSGGRRGERGEAPPPVHRRMRGRDERSRGEALVEERMPLGDDWDGARNTPMTRIDHAVRNEQERRARLAAGAGEKKRGGEMRVEMNGNGKIAVADTLLSPLENDPEYMTMRPRGIVSGKSGRGGERNSKVYGGGGGGGGSGGSGQSQKRPLLAAPEEDESSEGTSAPLLSHRPPLPAHGGREEEEMDDSMWQSRVYDDPHYESSQITKKSEATSDLIGDIDCTDDEGEAPPLPREAPPNESF